MKEIHYFLSYILLIIQLLAAFLGAIYFFRLKESYWKWFSIYLILIFVQELFWMNNSSLDSAYKVIYYAFFGIPIEFIFLYWLYALKSLQNRKIFLTAVLVYIVTISISALSLEAKEVRSLGINVGSIILIVLLILEFIKQIKTDDILRFKENKMFYINLGLIIFYIGNYPYHVFSIVLYENHQNIWNVYYTYFLGSNCIMYLLFSISFIWGKAQS